MPKMKTNRGAKKRFWVTGSGKIRRGKAGKSHCMYGKPANRLRRLRKHDWVKDVDETRVHEMLPYSF